MLSKSLAQKIVDSIMEIINYNINIMDKNGVIIASGDKARVGDMHSGAKLALKTKDIIELDCGIDGFGDSAVKCGVNIPISFNKRVIGVIGITGKPKEVRDFGRLVSVTAELLINQEYSIQKFIIKNKIIEEYIIEWLYKREDYDKDFIERGREINIRVKNTHNIYLIEYRMDSTFINSIKSLLEEDGLVAQIGGSKAVVILESTGKKNLLEILKCKYENKIVRVIESTVSGNLAIVFYGMNRALSNANKIDFKEKFIYKKQNIDFLASITEYLDRSDAKNILSIIEQEGAEILETFLIFSQFNFEKVRAAKELHIHRNTLAYRIGKIEEITGLSYTNPVDKFRLLGSYLFMLTRQSTKK